MLLLPLWLNFVFAFVFCCCVCCCFFTRLERNFNLPSGYFVQRILWRDLLTVLTTNARSSYDKIFNGLEYIVCSRYHRMVAYPRCVSAHEVGGFHFHNAYMHIAASTFADHYCSHWWNVCDSFLYNVYGVLHVTRNDDTWPPCFSSTPSRWNNLFALRERTNKTERTEFTSKYAQNRGDCRSIFMLISKFSHRPMQYLYNAFFFYFSSFHHYSNEPKQLRPNAMKKKQ